MSIEKFDLPSGTETQVVTDERAIHGMHGWRLLSIVVTSSPMLMNETESGPVYVNRQVARDSSSVRYVMVRDPNEVVEAAVQARWAAEAELRSSQKRAEVAADALKDAQGEISQLKNAHACSELNLKAANKTYADVVITNRRLEGDIGKLRAALGELRMKEILGDNKP